MLYKLKIKRYTARNTNKQLFIAQVTNKLYFACIELIQLQYFTESMNIRMCSKAVRLFV